MSGVASGVAAVGATGTSLAGLGGAASGPADSPVSLSAALLVGLVSGVAMGVVVCGAASVDAAAASCSNTSLGCSVGASAAGVGGSANGPAAAGSPVSFSAALLVGLVGGVAFGVVACAAPAAGTAAGSSLHTVLGSTTSGPAADDFPVSISAALLVGLVGLVGGLAMGVVACGAGASVGDLAAGAGGAAAAESLVSFSAALLVGLVGGMAMGVVACDALASGAAAASVSPNTCFCSSVGDSATGTGCAANGPTAADSSELFSAALLVRLVGGVAVARFSAFRPAPGAASGSVSLHTCLTTSAVGVVAVGAMLVKVVAAAGLGGAAGTDSPVPS